LASGDSEVLKTLKKGDTLTVTGQADNGWLPVRIGDATGWVSEQYVSKASQGTSSLEAPFAVAPSQWQKGQDQNFAKNTSFRTGTETIDGQQKDVLTVEVNLPGNSNWEGGQVVLERTNNTVMPKIRIASGVRFKALGDGKKWQLIFHTTETESDWGSYEYQIQTTANKVVEINAPYASLKQPSWGRRVSFNKNNITAVVLQRDTNTASGSSTIKIFDFEIW